jgi:hypothetical protein
MDPSAKLHQQATPFETLGVGKRRAVQTHNCDQFSAPELHDHAFRGTVFAVTRGTDFASAGSGGGRLPFYFEKMTSAKRTTL